MNVWAHCRATTFISDARSVFFTDFVADDRTCSGAAKGADRTAQYGATDNAAEYSARSRTDL